ncbi:MAG: DNA adenine methylase [Candidatus Woesearchaeota archaeon]
MKKLHLIAYIGGKNKICDKIIPLLDYSKTCYVELFGGGANVLLNKPRHKVEILNDFSKDKALIDYSDYFLDLIKHYYHHELLFKRLKNEVFGDEETKENVLRRAIKTFYCLNVGFSGEKKTFSYGFLRNKAFNFENKKNNLKLIIERLKNVQVLNRDCFDILEMIKDRDDIMLYADPPYFGTEKYYDTNFGSFDFEKHEKLADYLNNARYSVALSYAYFDGIEDLYPKNKWRYYEFLVYKCVPKKVNEKRNFFRDLLIVNYEPKFFKNQTDLSFWFEEQLKKDGR